jgi:iron complex outermembrane receptor protein
MAAPAQADGIETVLVVANAPLAGGGVAPDKIPGEIQTLSISDLSRARQNDGLPAAVASQLSSVSLNDEQGSPFQPDFVYRGFEASPISGVAEGLAVYQDGVRLNESFGDNVNWDLVPQFAVDTFTLQSNNPVFGLNTLAGAVTLAMKSGLTFQGADAQLSGGSFGNITGSAEIGGRDGKLGFYLGIGGVHDDGFRDHSPTRLRQAYGDIAYESGPWTLHLSLSGAKNDIDAVGPTPVEMLARDRRAVFTYPQAMRNEMALAQLRGAYRAADTLTLSFNAYYRHFRQHLIDGNTTDVAYCDNDAAQLCLEGDDAFPGDALYDTSGRPVPASVLPPGATPGETDFTQTDADTLGAALQIGWTTAIAGHANNLAAGASIDRGITDYNAKGELGTLLDSLRVANSGIVIDQSQSPTAQPPIEAPVNVTARNTYIGLYAVDVFDLTPALSLTVSGRLNIAHIRLQDRRGTALNGAHAFTRFNPGVGLTWKLAGNITAYGGYSESNRAPTAGELSCADPNSPCLLDAFLVSDPPLKQVVSRNIEAGLRGHWSVARLPGIFDGSVSAYNTNVARDILLLATDINGFGFFQNAGTTRRRGADVRLGYRSGRWTANLSYSYLEASFRSAENLSSNSPAADAAGLIHVRPGDRLPMNPANRVALSVEYAATRDWSIGGDIRYQSGQYFVGDESNEQPKLPGYATVNLHSAYTLGPGTTIFAEVDNIFDRHYATYGAFTDLDGLPPRLSLNDPRTISPAPGRLFFAGLRKEFD